MQSAYNGMRVSIARKNVTKLAALPGVAAIKAVPIRYADNSVSVPYLGVPQVWESKGFTGEGVKVAIIDTGIDYTHANFGGPGTLAAFNTAKASNTPNPAWFGPNAPRVKGGYDFVGDAYDASEAALATPHPDANPLDCNGHGTHVAGSTGGSGVLENGSTFTGPYDTTTHQNTFKVGPGVAPEVDFYAYKVFGCDGSTSVTTEAIDRAVADGIDVINMSLGSSYGRADDPDAITASNAVAAGVVVVASAGNSGPNPYLSGSPGSGRGVIAVAANDSTETFPGAKLSFAGTTMDAINANGLSPLPSDSFTIVNVKDDPATEENESLGCTVEAFAKSGITTAADAPKVVAVVQRGACARVAKAVWGQKAGADAVIMVNTAAGYPPYEGPITSNPDTGEAYTVTIPFLGVRSTDGPALAAAEGASLTMAAIQLKNPGFTAAASFSSGGPRTGDSGVKPNVVAPGVGIVSAGVGTGTGFEILSGTSMAAPHTTGVAALNVQAHPAWSAAEVSAAVVSTADPEKVAGYRLTLVGAGQVDTAQSVSSSVVALGDSYTAKGATQLDHALNFGFAEPSTSYTGTKTVTLVNKGSSSVTYQVSVEKTPQSRPATVTPSAGSVTVPAGGTATVDVSLDVPANTIGSVWASTGGQHKFYEVSGNVVLTANGAKLRVPYLLVPRAQAKVAATATGLAGPTATLNLTNDGGALGTYADVYTWGISDPKDITVSENLLSGSDIRAVGVQSFKDEKGDNLVIFAINNWTRFSNAGALEFDIAIDTNNDRRADSYLIGVDYGLATTGTTDGRMGVFIYNPKTGGLSSSGFFAVSPTDSSTLMLPVKGSDLVKGGQSGPIRYQVTSYDVANGLATDATGWAGYNTSSKPYGDGAFAAVPRNGSAQATIAVNTGQVTTQGALGLMVVVLDNKAGADEAILIAK